MTSAMDFVSARTAACNFKLKLVHKLNIIPLKEHKKIQGNDPHKEICNHKLVSYSGDNLTVLGTVKLTVKSKSDVYQEPTVHVLETHQRGLLGFDPHKTWA